jgi:DNA-binding NarL/FixJ family response regulator
MKQSVYPQIVRTLLELEESLRTENDASDNAENKRYIPLYNESPENLLSKIQKIHHLILKEKHKDVHIKLSQREAEIIQQICNGKTTDEIAKDLNLSKHTVESHRTNIFSKLDVKNVAELVTLAFRVGMVE